MTDDQTDSSAPADQPSEPVYSCDHCDSLLDMSTWTPTRTDDDGSVYRFCDDECRTEWSDD